MVVGLLVANGEDDKQRENAKKATTRPILDIRVCKEEESDKTKKFFMY